MMISMDTESFIDKYTDKETTDMICDAGFDAMDYCLANQKFYNGEKSEDELIEYFKNIRKYAESKGLSIHQTHSPCPSGSADEAEDKRLFDNIARSVKYASYLGAKIIVVHAKDHLVYEENGNPERLFEMNMDFYNRLKPYAEEYGVKIALENLPQQHRFSPLHQFWGRFKVVKSICSTPEEFVRYLDELNSDAFVACLDIGHAMIAGQNPSELIRRLGGRRLKALHVHDNDGLRDMHTIPFYGGMADWDEIVKALCEIGYDGAFSLEAGNFLTPIPTELYPAGTKMMGATARFLSNKISEGMKNGI